MVVSRKCRRCSLIGGNAMSAYIEMFKITPYKVDKTFLPLHPSISPRSRRAKRYDMRFRELHRKYIKAFRWIHPFIMNEVLETEVPVETVAYTQGWFFTNRLFKASYSQFIAFTKEEAIRMFRQLINWKHLTAYEYESIYAIMNYMLKQFSDDTFIVFSW